MFWKKTKADVGSDHGGPVEVDRASATVDANITSAPREKDATPAAGDATSASASSVPAVSTPNAPAASATASGEPIETGVVREQVIEQLRNVFDPEIPVNIYELGLVYKVDVSADGHVKIEMTLTSPACPSAAEIPLDVKKKAGTVPGVRSVEVEIVWDPPWTMEFMSEAARVQLGFF